MRRYLMIIKRLIVSPKIFFFSFSSFGLKIAIWHAYLYILPSKKNIRYFNTVEKYFLKFLKPVIDSFKIVTYDKKNQSFDKIPIWICWFSGENDMPEIVKMCYESVKKHYPKDISKIYLITSDNYNSYIQIPRYMVDKYEKKIISDAHFSDILRFSLLEKYGGLWLDATVFVTDDIPKEYIDCNYYTQKVKDINKFENEPSRAQWCGFIWAGYPHNCLYSFIKQALFFYWKKHNAVIDYIFFDYIILVAYKNFPEIKKLIDSQKPNNENIWFLWEHINLEFDEKEFVKLKEENIFHKLTYKGNVLKKTENGKDTYYGYLNEKYIN